MEVKITKDVRDILGKYEIISIDRFNIVRLPKLSNTQYDSIKYLIEFTGGHWSERFNGFKYTDNQDTIKSSIEFLLNVESIKISESVVFKIRTNFYPTPDWLAYKMVELADISFGDLVLEPSAGKAGILQYIVDKTDNYIAVECNDKQIDYLISNNYTIYPMTFEEYISNYDPGQVFDAIVMNPPFCDELDLRHIMLAYKLLKPGGRLIGLAAENSIYYDRPITKEFNTWLKSVNGIVEEIPSGTFKESGTNVDVVLISILK